MAPMEETTNPLARCQLHLSTAVVLMCVGSFIAGQLVNSSSFMTSHCVFGWPMPVAWTGQFCSFTLLIAAMINIPFYLFTFAVIAFSCESVAARHGKPILVREDARR